MINRPVGMVILAVFVLLAAAFLPVEESRFAALAAPQAGSGSTAPQTRSPLTRGPVADLNIAFTAQAIGWIEPCG